MSTTFNANNKVLSSLRQLDLPFNILESVCLKDEPQSRNLYHEASVLASRLGSRADELREYIANFSNDLYAVSVRITGIKQELDDKMVFRQLSNDSLSALTSSKEILKATLYTLRRDPLVYQRVPEEIWISIFQHRVDAEVITYLSGMSDKSLPATALHLSHVCRHWRQIIYCSLRLWQYIPIPGSPFWADNDRALFDHIVSTSALKDIDLVVNSAPTTTNGSDIAFKIAPLSSRPFNLHISFGNWTQDGAQSRLVQPHALFLYGRSARDDQDDLYPVQFFPGIRRLVLTGIQKFERAHLPTLTELRYLRMELTTFEDFDLHEQLVPSLEELHIQHHGKSILSMSRTPQLPNLRTLGITPYDIVHFLGADFPSLRRIVLYRPLIMPPSSLYERLQEAIPVIKSIQELEFCGWTWNKGPWTVARMVEKILPNLRDLVKIKFTECFVNGQDLIRAFSQHSLTSDTIAITLDHCKGIKQSECEELLSLLLGVVVSLSVYA